jgi:hypothetical protein
VLLVLSLCAAVYHADVFPEPEGLPPERDKEHTIELTAGSRPPPQKCYRHSNRRMVS